MLEREIFRQQQNLQRQFDNLPQPEVGRWQSFTPTINQGGAVAATVTFARYITLNDAVIMQARLAITAAGVGGNSITIGGFPTAILPTNAASAEHVVGTFLYFDAGVGFYQGALVYVGVNTFRGILDGRGNYFGLDPAVTTANNDNVGIQGSWER